jgi:hypothetical protein
MAMDELQNAFENFNYVKNNLTAIVEDCMREEQEPIVNLNKSQLYTQGVDSEGEPLPPYHSDEYAMMKYKMRGEFITDASLTGDFQAAMSLIVADGEYEMNSSDPKTNKLLAKEGWGKIFGLTKDSQEKTQETIHDPLVYKIAAYTGAGVEE